MGTEITESDMRERLCQPAPETIGHRQLEREVLKNAAASPSLEAKVEELRRAFRRKNILDPLLAQYIAAVRQCFPSFIAAHLLGDQRALRRLDRKYYRRTQPRRSAPETLRASLEDFLSPETAAIIIPAADREILTLQGVDTVLVRALSNHYHGHRLTAQALGIRYDQVRRIAFRKGTPHYAAPLPPTVLQCAALQKDLGPHLLASLTALYCHAMNERSQRSAAAMVSHGAAAPALQALTSTARRNARRLGAAMYLQQCLTAVFDDAHAAEKFVSQDRAGQVRTPLGFQQAMVKALYARHRTYSSVASALGIMRSKVAYLCMASIRAYVPDARQRYAAHAAAMQERYGVSELLPLIRALYISFVERRTGSSETAHQVLRARHAVGKHRRDLRLPARASPGSSLREIVGGMVTKPALGQLVPSRSHPNLPTYRGFHRILFEELYRTLESYHAVAAVLGTAAGYVHRILTDTRLEHPTAEKPTTRYAAAPKQFLSMREFSDMYNCHAVDAMRRGGKSLCTAARHLKANPRALERRVERGRAVLGRPDFDFRRWVRDVFPEPDPIIAGEYTSRQAREQYIVSVCGLLGDNIPEAAHALGTTGTVLRRWYGRIRAAEQQAAPME